jgi:hypothetical protein
MSALPGQRLHLRQIERHFPDTTMTVQRDCDSWGRHGVSPACSRLVGLLGGYELDERTIDRSIGMVR